MTGEDEKAVFSIPGNTVHFIQFGEMFLVQTDAMFFYNMNELQVSWYAIGLHFFK